MKTKELFIWKKWTEEWEDPLRDYVDWLTEIDEDYKPSHEPKKQKDEVIYDEDDEGLFVLSEEEIMKNKIEEERDRRINEIMKEEGLFMISEEEVMKNKMEEEERDKRIDEIFTILCLPIK